MKTIGFAGQFYTLWDVKSENIKISEGASYNKITYTYFKNLSKNLEEAIEKAGTDNFDESLRGKRKSFECKQQVVVEPREMSNCERLFRVIFVNDKENRADGVRQAAFDRCLELGYLTEIEGNFYDMEGNKSNLAYKFNHELRCEDEWYSNTLDKFFIGVV